MKFSNKFINGLLLAGLFPFLFGCDKNEAVFVYSKGIEIYYVDKEGNILYFDKEGNIKYFDKNDYPLLKVNEEDFLKTLPIEILSFTNGSGIPVGYRFSCRVDHLFGFVILENEGRKREYSYIIKYKIPPLTGESVEEIRVTLKETEYGIPDGWHNCQYNGRNIRPITIEEIFPDWHDPQQVIDEKEHARRLTETLYNGNLVAYESDGTILLIIPIDIVPEHN
jgi:hypothetical protein